jgi:urea carboxylase system permease
MSTSSLLHSRAARAWMNCGPADRIRPTARGRRDRALIARRNSVDGIAGRVPFSAAAAALPREDALRTGVLASTSGISSHVRAKQEEEIVAGSAQDQSAQDDAHLRSLGIKPELRRSLGFLSNFAVAFSYISVSTGTFTLIALGLGVGGPAFFWSWPLVILGQTFVALNFAELASHFPVAGSIYQWSKRLSNRTLGWFTGWFYFWAGVLTVCAVAGTVPLVLSSIFGFALTDPSPIGITNNLVFWAVITLISTTLINAFGIRLLAVINNIGVGAEILGMLVFAVILLIFANHQSPSVLFQTAGTETPETGGYLPIFAVAAFMSLFVVYGFDTAGTFGEETIDAGRQAPRGILSAIWLSGIIGAIFLLAIILATPDMTKALTDTSPISTAIKTGLGDTFGSIYLFVILAAVYVCTLAIHGATVRLMFSMGRDRRMPLGSIWGHVNDRFKTPTNAAIAVGVLAAIPFILTDSPGLLAIGATGLIYLSYFLCNLGVLVARTKGWPKQGAWFKLGSWGTILNVLALIWGGVMLVNFGLWKDPNLFGNFGSDLRNLTNPSLTGLTSGGKPISWLPDIPFFEATIIVILVTGAIYYVVSVRGRETIVDPDLATGEAVIG